MIVVGNCHVKRTNDYENVTKSKRFCYERQQIGQRQQQQQKQNGVGIVNSELLQQLMGNNRRTIIDNGVGGGGGGRGGGGKLTLQKKTTIGNGNDRQQRQQTCYVSQPSDSVLMNLLVSGFDIRAGYICLAPNVNNVNDNVKRKVK